MFWEQRLKCKRTLSEKQNANAREKNNRSLFVLAQEQGAVQQLISSEMDCNLFIDFVFRRVSNKKVVHDALFCSINPLHCEKNIETIF